MYVHVCFKEIPLKGKAAPLSPEEPSLQTNLLAEKHATREKKSQLQAQRFSMGMLFSEVKISNKIYETNDSKYTKHVMEHRTKC
jgi:hypothetical protein